MKKKLLAAVILVLAVCLCIVKPAANASDVPAGNNPPSKSTQSGPSDSKDDKIQEIIGGGNRTEADSGSDSEN